MLRGGLLHGVSGRGNPIVGWLDAGVRGKVGGWWVGVSVYCELEKYADILHSVRSISHQTWSGSIGWAVCGKPGCPSRVSSFCPRGTTEQSLDHADSRPALFPRLNITPRQWNLTKCPSHASVQ